MATSFTVTSSELDGGLDIQRNRVDVILIPPICHPDSDSGTLRGADGHRAGCVRISEAAQASVTCVSTLWLANVMAVWVSVPLVESSVAWMAPPFSARLLTSNETPSASRSPTSVRCS